MKSAAPGAAPPERTGSRVGRPEGRQQRPKTDWLPPPLTGRPAQSSLWQKSSEHYGGHFSPRALHVCTATVWWMIQDNQSKNKQIKKSVSTQQPQTTFSATKSCVSITVVRKIKATLLKFQQSPIAIEVGCFTLDQRPVDHSEARHTHATNAGLPMSLTCAFLTHNLLAARLQAALTTPRLCCHRKFILEFF